MEIENSSNFLNRWQMQSQSTKCKALMKKWRVTPFMFNEKSHFVPGRGLCVMKHTSNVWQHPEASRSFTAELSSAHWHKAHWHTAHWPTAHISQHKQCRGQSSTYSQTCSTHIQTCEEPFVQPDPRSHIFSFIFQAYTVQSQDVDWNRGFMEEMCQTSLTYRGQTSTTCLLAGFKSQSYLADYLQLRWNNTKIFSTKSK